MLHPKIFKQIQNSSNHTFTLDARTNSKGDNALCARYCSVEDSFLDKDLKGEFVWLNPPFKRAREFLEAYFAQKRAYPGQVGACILLPCWRQFANIPKLRQMTILKQFTPGTHLYSQPGQGQSNRRTWRAFRGRSMFTMTRHGARPSMHRRIKVIKLWSSRPK